MTLLSAAMEFESRCGNTSAGAMAVDVVAGVRWEVAEKEV